ncbi:MAG: tautomerase family protein [Ruminococcus sp.]|nr:tautomerase family protein [Ruminococcus sp.]
MPHITIKMLKGRTNQQKTIAGIKVADALAEAIGCDPTHISVAVEDFTPTEWQDVFKEEVTNNNNIVVQPDYDPKSLLK